ncbi:MAG: hypothetical protein ACXV9P_03505 [Acidimicrobiia bacterium]
MTELTPDEAADSFGLVASTVRESLASQREAMDRLETKATILLGFVATAVPIYVVQSPEGTQRDWAVALYAVAAIFGLLVTRPYKHGTSPDPKKFASKFVATPQPSASVARYLAADAVRAYTRNELTMKVKAVLLWITLLTFIGGAALSVGSLLP